jgi:hypothetical protein
MCNNNCQNIDRDNICLKTGHADCTGDPECHLIIAGEEDCSNECEYSGSGNQYYKTFDRHTSSTTIVNQVLQVSAYCGKDNMCVDKDRNCHEQYKSAGYLSSSNVDDKIAYCGGANNPDAWMDCDYSQIRCSVCSSLPYVTMEWTEAGEPGVGEYGTGNGGFGITECCGDDADEYLTIRENMIACCKSPNGALDSNGNCIENNSPYGYLDDAKCDYAGGWTKDLDTSDPIYVHIYFDPGANQLVKQTRAEIYRSDLEAAGIGDGHHAFHYVYPKDVLEKICDGGSHIVNAYGLDYQDPVYGPNIELTGSSKTISSCGYYKENGDKYACCKSPNNVLDSDGNCVG